MLSLTVVLVVSNVVVFPETVRLPGIVTSLPLKVVPSTVTSPAEAATETLLAP